MRSSITLAAAAAVFASSASAATIKINVGETGLTFSPNSTTAAVGDELEFHFFPRNHDVVQGAFNAPCDTGSVTAGFSSGFVPSTSGAAPNVFRVTVNNTQPIWYYCSQQSHCQGGMVGVVNPPTSGANTLDAYRTNASSTSRSTTPGAVAGGVLVASSSTGTTTTTSTGTAATTSPTSTGTSGAERMGGMRWTEMVGVTGLVGLIAGFMV